MDRPLRECVLDEAVLLDERESVEAQARNDHLNVVTGSRSVDDGDLVRVGKSMSQQPTQALHSSQTTVRLKPPVPSEIDVFVCEPDAVAVTTLRSDDVPTQPPITRR